MFKHNLLRWGLAVAICLGLALIGVISGYAQPPDNDDFSSPTVITELPYSDTMYPSEATIADDDPRPSCLYYSMGATVWYAFTPADDLLVEISTAGSNYDTILAIYTGTRGSLTEEACHTYQDAWRANLSEGVTYYFMVGSFYYYNPYPPPERYRLTLSISEVLPPGNDSFADATVITGLPFEESVDTTAATLETGEPVPLCAYRPFEASVWYTFTPSESGPISALMPDYYYFEPVMAVYRGTSLSDLTQLNCQGWGSRVTIYGEAGTAYYYQVGGMWGGRGGGAFRLEVTPPPYVGFYYDPGDPSSFDTIHFWGDYGDPGNVGIASVTWDFGDGTTATSSDNWISHRYAADGDYTVSLTVTTHDGRSASTSQVVSVRTHDVAITRVTAPKAASVGQTRSISVYIRNYHYPEQVMVHLAKSVPGGYAWVGDLSQQVPVRHGTRTTRFDFSYTFTKEDAQMGKVTFKAVAEVLTGRDALPADNEAISPPTKVNR